MWTVLAATKKKSSGKHFQGVLSDRHVFGCKVPKLAATATIAGTWETVNQNEKQGHLTKAGTLEMAKVTVNDPEAPTDIRQSSSAHQHVAVCIDNTRSSSDSMTSESVGNLFAPRISDNEVRSKSAAGAAPIFTTATTSVSSGRQPRASAAGSPSGLSYLQRDWRVRPQPRLRPRFQRQPRHGDGRCEPYNADRDYHEGEANHFSRDQCRSFDAERWTEFAEVQATAKTQAKIAILPRGGHLESIDTKASSREYSERDPKKTPEKAPKIMPTTEPKPLAEAALASASSESEAESVLSPPTSIDHKKPMSRLAAGSHRAAIVAVLGGVEENLTEQQRRRGLEHTESNSERNSDALPITSCNSGHLARYKCWTPRASADAVAGHKNHSVMKKLPTRQRAEQHRITTAARVCRETKEEARVD